MGHTYICPKCGTPISSTFLRNLNPLIEAHVKWECRPIAYEMRNPTEFDKKFLSELLVSWGES